MSVLSLIGILLVQPFGLSRAAPDPLLHLPFDGSAEHSFLPFFSSSAVSGARIR